MSKVLDCRGQEIKKGCHVIWTDPEFGYHSDYEVCEKPTEEMVKLTSKYGYCEALPEECKVVGPIKITRNTIQGFLDSLISGRFTKKELEKEVQDFFGVKNELNDSTVKDDKSFDYSFIFTSQTDTCDKYADIEIYYLKTRQRNHIYVTETILLEYVD